MNKMSLWNNIARIICERLEGNLHTCSIVIKNGSCCIELWVVRYNMAIINLTNDFDHEVHGRLYLMCNCLFCYKWAIEWVASKVSIESRDVYTGQWVALDRWICREHNGWCDCWPIVRKHSNIFSGGMFGWWHYLHWSDVFDAACADLRSSVVDHIFFLSILFYTFLLSITGRYNNSVLTYFFFFFFVLNGWL